MVFNSFNFLAFIIPVVLMYWLFFSRSSVLQNVMLLLSSITFYVIGDWRFFALLTISIFVNFYLGIHIFRLQNERKRTLTFRLGTFLNIGLLVYFKYFNFFIKEFSELLNLFGFQSLNSLNIILPLGISFYTFQLLGYLIDVYNEKVKPNESLLEFSVFVLFFPKMLSGPIERATNLIPQLQKVKNFKYEVFVDGLRQILWGLFAKIVVAENCAALVNSVYIDYENQPGSTLLIGAFFYAIQLYADFSGYSNIAIGVAKLFGIQLMRNFSTPYFSTNVADYWRSWHISLTTWMMDYVFTPLSFILRKYEKHGLMLSIVITFILVGFWHGANWTFVIYGLLHGFYFVPLVFTGKMNKSNNEINSLIPSPIGVVKMLGLFVLVVLTDIFFRAPDVNDAFKYLEILFSVSLLERPDIMIGSTTNFTLLFMSIYFAVEWLNKYRSHDFEISNAPLLIRWGSYVTIFTVILIFGRSTETFIYFQF